MYDIFIWSRILGRWDQLQSVSSLDSAMVIAGRYSWGAYSINPAWVHIKDSSGKVIFDSHGPVYQEESWYGDKS